MPRSTTLRQERLIALAVAVVQFPVVAPGVALLAVEPPAKGRLTVLVRFGTVVLVLPIAPVALAEVFLIAGRVGTIKAPVDAAVTLQEA